MKVIKKGEIFNFNGRRVLFERFDICYGQTSIQLKNLDEGTRQYPLPGVMESFGFTFISQPGSPAS